MYFIIDKNNYTQVLAYIHSVNQGIGSTLGIHTSTIYQLAPPTLVTVVNNPTLSTILNMADSVASSVSKNFFFTGMGLCLYNVRIFNVYIYIDLEMTFK